jgi:serine/threonine-protein kinase
MSELELQGSEPSLPSESTEHSRSLKRGDLVAGKYALVSYLARGGMAEVWLATHKELKNEVAIKFVHEHLAQDTSGGPWALERFRFEAQISARMASHTRHTVAVLDAGTHQGAPYLVMEYVPGSTLEADVEQNGPITPERYAQVLDQVADALDAAHAMGIIHRDLKPSNFLLCDTTDQKGLFVKVADFGVAKAVDSTLALDRPRETQRGEVIGSPAFMSPEQLRGVPDLDARSDIWSLGVVSYEMLTGEECFEGKTIMDTFASISMRRFRPPSTVKEGLPRGIDAWMDRALAQEPKDRFQTVTEMAEAFRLLLKPAVNPARGAAFAVLGLVAVALVAFGVVRLTTGTTTATPASTTQAVALAPTQAPSGAAPPPVPETVSTQAQTPVSVAPTATGRAPSRTNTSNTPPRASATPTSASLPTSSPTSLPTSVPPPTADPAPPPPRTKRPPKGIDPSEIQ